MATKKQSEAAKKNIKKAQAKKTMCMLRTEN
jgi:hypothetical protein